MYPAARTRYCFHTRKLEKLDLPLDCALRRSFVSLQGCACRTHRTRFERQRRLRRAFVDGDGPTCHELMRFLSGRAQLSIASLRGAEETYAQSECAIRLAVSHGPPRVLYGRLRSRGLAVVGGGQVGPRSWTCQGCVWAVTARSERMGSRMCGRTTLAGACVLRCDRSPGFPLASCRGRKDRERSVSPPLPPAPLLMGCASSACSSGGGGRRVVDGGTPKAGPWPRRCVEMRRRFRRRSCA